MCAHAGRVPFHFNGYLYQGNGQCHREKPLERRQEFTGITAVSEFLSLVEVPFQATPDKYNQKWGTVGSNSVGSPGDHTVLTNV